MKKIRKSELVTKEVAIELISINVDALNLIYPIIRYKKRKNYTSLILFQNSDDFKDLILQEMERVCNLDGDYEDDVKFFENLTDLEPWKNNPDDSETNYRIIDFIEYCSKFEFIELLMEKLEYYKYFNDVEFLIYDKSQEVHFE